MPDAFLRRVIAQREIEQEAEIIAIPLETFAPEHCRVCGKRLSMTEGAELGRDRATVCTECGGRKKQRKLEAEDARRAAEQRRLHGLLALVGFTPTSEEAMPETEGKLCTKCNKTKLRANSTGDVCFACRRGAPGEEGEASAPKPGPKKSAVRKKFFALCDLVGEDGDRLLEDFMSGYVDRISAAAKRAVEG